MNSFSLKQRVVSYVLKAVVFISAVLGTFLSAYAGRNSFMGGKNVFMYFTIQSNIAVAVISLIGFCLMKSGREISSIWYIIKFVGAVSITLTGAVFCFVLAPTLGGGAWNIQNILTHVVVPIAAVIDYFVTGVSGSIKKRSTIWVIIPPLIYAVYAGIGYKLNWQFSEGYNYPYFFLNWGSPAGAFGFTNELPFMGTAWWILALLIALLIVGYLYLLLIDLLKKLNNKT
ncbi:MAG: Pr6Pr family membrane protein [Ruminococcus sp.]|uniref:Pr6Pr family membrane protein n=1 Tax=Ruminococcus sp. TaxID=41978 RepID=UPI0025D3E1C5|nr:Pr6Pr family membrane protein [Ruminococcus sp.]MBO4867973.1 Pr6Pr family membrane protein [Ruminococcus sp.]